MDRPPPKTTTTTTAPPLFRHLIALDTTLSYHLHTIAQPHLPHSLLILLELSADFRSLFILSLALLLAPSTSSTPLLRRTALPLGLLLDIFLVRLIKPLVQRSRPHYNINTDPVYSYKKPDSFPSGHASRVCFVAALLYLSAAAITVELRSSMSTGKWISSLDESKAVNFVVLVAWVWAVATSVSRVVLGRHFMFDVFSGGCLGVLEALFAFHFLCFPNLMIRGNASYSEKYSIL